MFKRKWFCTSKSISKLCVVLSDHAANHSWQCYILFRHYSRISILFCEIYWKSGFDISRIIVIHCFICLYCCLQVVYWQSLVFTMEIFVWKLTIIPCLVINIFCYNTLCGFCLLLLFLHFHPAGLQKPMMSLKLVGHLASVTNLHAFTSDNLWPIQILRHIQENF